MEDKYDWYSKEFLVTKEEVIALRTLYLEFGDEKTKKLRLELPYENIVYEYIKAKKRKVCPLIEYVD